MRATVPILIALSIATACGDDEPTPPAGRDAVVAAWKKAGLSISEMKPTAGKSVAGECQAGTAGGVEVTLCTFGDAAAATAAQPAGLAAIGDATGASLAQGPMLLIVADRRKVDPSGRTIHQLTKTFRGRT